MNGWVLGLLFCVVFVGIFSANKKLWAVRKELKDLSAKYSACVITRQKSSAGVL